MKKLFAILMALLLVASFSVTAFATEAGNDEIPSPTDVPLVIVDFDSQHPGQISDVFENEVESGTQVTFVAPESEYDFIGFQIECAKAEGEGYEVVSGAQYIVDGSATRTAERPTLVLKVYTDIRVIALYDIDGEETEPTTATQPDDEEGDSPQTGDSMLVWCIAGALVLGVVGFAFAGKKLLKKEN